MEFVNLTPHAIVVRGEAGDTVFPPSGAVARVSSRSMPIPAEEEIPLARTVFGEPIGLPEPAEGVMLIVSMIVRQAVPGRGDVCSPDTGPDAFRNASGQIEAVRRLIVN